MLDLSITTEDTSKRVVAAADQATFKNLGHAIATIRGDAIASIKPGEGPSAAGTPPHTHTGGVGKNGKTRKGVLQKAIVFHQDKALQQAIAGPRFSVAGDVGEGQEFGGEFRGQQYPERAFMGPAKERNEDRFAQGFVGSIGE